MRRGARRGEGCRGPFSFFLSPVVGLEVLLLIGFGGVGMGGVHSGCGMGWGTVRGSVAEEVGGNRRGFKRYI